MTAIMQALYPKTPNKWVPRARKYARQFFNMLAWGRGATNNAAGDDEELAMTKGYVERMGCLARRTLRVCVSLPEGPEWKGGQRLEAESCRHPTLAIPTDVHRSVNLGAFG